jgi:hypothetical protein
VPEYPIGRPECPTNGVDGINLLLSRVADIYEPGYDALQIMLISAVNGWVEVAKRLSQGEIPNQLCRQFWLDAANSSI